MRRAGVLLMMHTKGATTMVHAVRLPSWGLSVGRAEYYGYRVGLVIGPWLLFAFPVEH